MTKLSIQIYLLISLIIALLVGVYILIWWYRKVSKRLYKSIEKGSTVKSIGMKTLFYNFPSLIIFIILFIPSLYFGYLLKQHTYCKNVFEVNSKRSTGFDINDEEFINECGCFDVTELTDNKINQWKKEKDE